MRSPQIVSPALQRLQAIAVMISAFLLAGVLLGENPLQFNARPNAAVRCIPTGNHSNLLSREQLRELQTLISSSGDQLTRSDLRNLLDQPSCQAARFEIAAGQWGTGDGYPLAFDPQTRLIVLFNDDRYVGYRFEFR
jgi:hypothetical protein